MSLGDTEFITDIAVYNGQVERGFYKIVHDCNATQAQQVNQLSRTQSSSI